MPRIGTDDTSSNRQKSHLMEPISSERDGSFTINVRRGKTSLRRQNACECCVKLGGQRKMALDQ